MWGHLACLRHRYSFRELPRHRPRTPDKTKQMENGDFSRLGGRLGLVQLLLLLIVQTAYAGSATWKTNPINNSWNDARNWTPETVPNGPGDVATFATSGITSIFLSDIEVSEIVFNPGASSFTVTSDS